MPVATLPRMMEDGDMSEDPKAQQLRLAELAAAIERAAGDLAVGEEPARFIQALEDEADRESPR